MSDHTQLAQKYLEASSKVPVVPGSADDYKFEFPEGYEVADEDLAGFRESAFKMGMTQQQYAEILQFNVDRESRMMEKMKSNIAADHEAGVESLKKAWGASYEENTELAKRVFRTFADDDMKKMIEDTKFGDNPQVVRLFHAIGAKLSEDVLQPISNKNTPAQNVDEMGRPMLQFNSMKE